MRGWEHRKRNTRELEDRKRDQRTTCVGAVWKGPWQRSGGSNHAKKFDELDAVQRHTLDSDRMQTVCRRTDCLLCLQQTEERTTVMGEREEDKGRKWRWSACYTLVTSSHRSRATGAVTLASPNTRNALQHSRPSAATVAHTCRRETRPHEPSPCAAAAHHHPLLRRHCVRVTFGIGTANVTQDTVTPDN